MKKIVCLRKKFFLVGIIVFLMFLVNGCSGSGDKTDPFANKTDYTDKTDQTGIAGLTALTGLTTDIVDWINNYGSTESNWEVLTAPDIYDVFSDFTPEGASVLYTGEGSSFYNYVFPTAGNPNGVFNTLANPYGSIDAYSSFAWFNGYLYTAQSSSIYRYNISGNSWTKPQGGLAYGFSMSQSTADGNGYVYAGTDDGKHLLKYNTSLNTVQFIDTPTTFPASEPRAAWDSQTQRVYLADYCYEYLYAFNPADNSFTVLAPFPNSNGVSDAFCSDRQGHIYTTSGNDGSLTDVWMYTAATDSWTQILSLPFAPGNSAVCTVSADGYLYLGNGSTQELARLKVF